MGWFKRPPLGVTRQADAMEGTTPDMTETQGLVREAGLGLAPGVAFGEEGEGWLRWCFASRDLGRLARGVERLAGFLPV